MLDNGDVYIVMESWIVRATAAKARLLNLLSVSRCATTRSNISSVIPIGNRGSRARFILEENMINDVLYRRN